VTVDLLLVALMGAGIPHLLPLRRVTPVSAAAIWLSALSLRALAIVLGLGWLILFFPGTSMFDALTHWCWRHVVSGGVNGHDVGHVTTLVPAALGTLSLLSVGLALRRGGRVVRSRLARARSTGPAESVIVGGPDVSLAVVGFLRPRVVVSAGALLQLDDAELEAALAHEQAHIVRWHRYVLLYGELCGALGRVLPGTRAALRELAFQLERDADRWALTGAVDREALAGALRKAARPPGSTALALSGSTIEQRLREILDGRRETRRGAVGWRAVATALTALALAVSALAAPALAAGAHVVHTAPAHASSDC